MLLGPEDLSSRIVRRCNNDSGSHVISGCHLCVAEDRTRVLVSSAKVLSPARNSFVSSVEVSQNAFGASDKHVYLKVSSRLRDYLVASDERVRLQCDIVFGLVFVGE